MCTEIAIVNHDEMRITTNDETFIQKRISNNEDDDSFSDEECVCLVHLLYGTPDLHEHVGDLIMSIYKVLFLKTVVPGLVRAALMDISETWWKNACSTKLNVCPPPTINMMLEEYGRRADFEHNWNRIGKLRRTKK